MLSWMWQFQEQHLELAWWLLEKYTEWTFRTPISVSGKNSAKLLITIHEDTQWWKMLSPQSDLCHDEWQMLTFLRWAVLVKRSLTVRKKCSFVVGFFFQIGLVILQLPGFILFFLDYLNIVIPVTTLLCANIHVKQKNRTTIQEVIAI